MLVEPPVMFTDHRTRMFEILLGKPWLSLLIALILVVASSVGAGFLHFRSDERVFFASDNPDLARLETFEARYGKDDTLLLLIEAKTGDLVTPERLTAMATIVDDLWTMSMVKRVDAPTNFQIASGDGEGLVIDQLWRLGDPTDTPSLERLRERAQQTDLLMGRLLTEDFRTALVALKFRIPPDQVAQASEGLTGELRNHVAQWREAYPELTFRISGSMALNTTFGEASAQDSALLIPLMFVVLLALLWLMVGSLVPVLISFTVITAAIASALGVGGYLGVPMTSVSVAAPFVITIVAVCDTVHFAFAAAEARHKGHDRRAAVIHAAKMTAWPVLLASLTTAVGFFSLLFSDSPPFAHLGLLCGLGTVFAYIYAMTIGPALLTLIPWKGREALVRFGPAIGRVAGWAARRPFPAMLLALIPALGAAAFIGNNRLDDRYVHYFDERFEFRRDADALNRTLGGFYTLEYDLPSPADAGVSNPGYLTALDRFGQWMRAQPEVTHVANHADRIKMVHRAMLDGAAEAYRVPADPAIAAQLLALYEMRLPFGMDLREQVTADRSASRMTVALKDVSTAETLALANRASAWIAREAPLLSSGSEATGTTTMFAHIGMRNIENMVLGTSLEFAVVGGMLLLAFRSFWMTGVAMVANILPAIAALGGWGLLVGEVGMAVAAVVAVTLGIVVDDTIHSMTALRRARARGLRSAELAREAFTEIGPGMLATTVCLAAGFFTLALSGFQINAWLGLMTGIVIVIAVIFDLLFIPAAFTLLSKKDA
ncbi:efflux RND transporter permease subunit [Teichococcus vastitatis]|uniref:MMPL family transporter n=1 Tax=Teichococcus vastitatis TaxID=2307076 RepID=A0ABS9WAZ6_9PROT|nr:MMPL family transporter [Pseudoroseomonas vastitatis]MCI0755769.1 MMPL family transporter [Pseudoroseomonas vastitatis]